MSAHLTGTVSASASSTKQEMPGRRQTTEWGQVAWQVIEVLVAETVGTGMLLFFGCMGLVSWVPDGTLPPLQGAIVFAVVVVTVIQIFGHISAAHLNPAVTVAFWVLGHVSPLMAAVYLAAECCGAVLGYGLLILVTPAELASSEGPPGLCCTVPHQHLSDLQAVAVEFCATCFLVLVVCSCLDPRNRDKADSAPLKFGCTILALSVAAGPYTGASMNPARSLGPALWTGTWTSHWVYWLGPCLAGVFSAVFYQAMFRYDPPTPSHEEVPLHQIKADLTQPQEKTKQLSVAV